MCAIAVDVPLGDLPVVGARVARRAGVGEDDAALELARVDVERDAADAVDAQLDGGDPAVQRRPIVLHAGRHADRLALDVHRHLQQILGVGSSRRSSGRARRTRRWSAPTSRRCRRRPAIRRASSASRSRAGSAARAARAAAARRSPISADQSPPRPLPVGVDRDAARSGRRSRGSIRACARRLMAAFTRRRAVVEQVQRPDVDRAAGQIDARRRRGDDGVGTAELYGHELEFVTDHVAACASSSDRSAAHRRIRRRRRFRSSCDRSRASSASAASSSSRGTSPSPSRSPSSSLRGGPARCRTLPVVGERRSGGRPRRAPEGAVHRVAADGDARAERRRRAGRALRAGAGGRAEGRRHHARLRAGARRPHESEESGHRRSRAGGATPDEVARLGSAIIRGAAGARASPPAASTFPDTATPAPTRISSCRSSSIRRSGCARSSSCRSGRRSRPASPRIMTAHVLRAGARRSSGRRRCRKRIVTGLLRERAAAIDGVILSDDLEMKAIAGQLRRA